MSLRRALGENLKLEIALRRYWKCERKMGNQCIQTLSMSLLALFSCGKRYTNVIAKDESKFCTNLFFSF